MRIIVLATLLFVGSSVWAAHNLQQRDCFPNTPEAKGWPVQAIYLHGLYSEGATRDGVENSNRDFLERYARENKIRIAVPVARALGGQHQWNGLSVQAVESMASQACGGAPLAAERAVIGYSNGGKWAGELSHKCGESGPYTKIIVIGYPEATRGKCTDTNRYMKLDSHSQFQNMQRPIHTQLAALPPNGPTQVAAADPKRLSVDKALDRAEIATGKAFSPAKPPPPPQQPTPPPVAKAPQSELKPYVPSEQRPEVKARPTKVAQLTPPAPPAAKVEEKKPTPPAPQTKGKPDLACQSECTSIDLGLGATQ